MALNRIRKVYLFTIWELKQEGGVPVANACGGWLKFCHSVNDHEMSGNEPKISVNDPKSTPWTLILGLKAHVSQ